MKVGKVVYFPLLPQTKQLEVLVEEKGSEVNADDGVFSTLLKNGDTERPHFDESPLSSWWAKAKL